MWSITLSPWSTTASIAQPFVPARYVCELPKLTALISLSWYSLYCVFREVKVYSENQVDGIILCYSTAEISVLTQLAILLQIKFSILVAELSWTLGSYSLLLGKTDTHLIMFENWTIETNIINTTGRHRLLQQHSTTKAKLLHGQYMWVCVCPYLYVQCVFVCMCISQNIKQVGHRLMKPSQLQSQQQKQSQQLWAELEQKTLRFQPERRMNYWTHTLWSCLQFSDVFLVFQV